MISIPAGTMPFAIMSATQFPESSMLSNPIKTALTDSGFFNILTVTSVTTPSKPSDPVTRPKKS